MSGLVLLLGLLLASCVKSQCFYVVRANFKVFPFMLVFLSLVPRFFLVMQLKQFQNNAKKAPKRKIECLQEKIGSRRSLNPLCSVKLSIATTN